ncbi:MAG: ketopantoate reductase family protein [Anaerolineae bacterium]|nr:ketopantoate reductase family protein [Anaerolineae bacterium]
MRIVVLGAGGVGGYYGGLLARAGHDVTLVARGAHLAALRAQGLCVESVHGDFEVAPVNATDDAAALEPADLVLVTVKSYDLERVVEGARGLVGEKTAVLPLLNGLDAAERVAAVIGDGPVLVGLTHISSSIAAPGVIRQVSPLRRITFGERDGRETERARHIRDVLAGTGIEVVFTSAVERALWTKFLFIASIGGVCCLARQPIGPVLATAETRALYVEALREVESVARARGVTLASEVVEQALELTVGFPADTRPSMLVDLEAGRRLELEAMSGTVVRYGREVGVETPVHGVIYAALKPSAGTGSG